MDQITKVPNLKKKPIGVKLAPYFDLLHFDKAASIICKYPIQYIVTANSMGNCLVVDYERECSAILPKHGLGGLGGGYLKPAALANVFMLYKKVAEYGRSDIDIVGVGGIGSGKDAFEMILCGAKAVQLGTIYWNEGTVCFERIVKELQDIMRAKGYSSINDFCGKLKQYYEPDPNLKSAVVSKTKASKKYIEMEDYLTIVAATIIVLLATAYVTRYWWAG